MVNNTGIHVSHHSWLSVCLAELWGMVNNTGIHVSHHSWLAVCLAELWGVVNNAGICYIGCLEIMSETDIQRVIDVNFMGQIHVIRAFLPLLRESQGRLINVASNAGEQLTSRHSLTDR